MFRVNFQVLLYMTDPEVTVINPADQTSTSWNLVKHVSLFGPGVIQQWW